MKNNPENKKPKDTATPIEKIVAVAAITKAWNEAKVKIANNETYEKGIKNFAILANKYMENAIEAIENDNDDKIGINTLANLIASTSEAYTEETPQNMTKEEKGNFNNLQISRYRSLVTAVELMKNQPVPKNSNGKKALSNDQLYDAFQTNLPVDNVRNIPLKGQLNSRIKIGITVLKETSKAFVENLKDAKELNDEEKKIDILRNKKIAEVNTLMKNETLMDRIGSSAFALIKPMTNDDKANTRAKIRKGQTKAKMDKLLKGGDGNFNKDLDPDLLPSREELDNFSLEDPKDKKRKNKNRKKNKDQNTILLEPDVISLASSDESEELDTISSASSDGSILEFEGLNLGKEKPHEDNHSETSSSRFSQISLASESISIEKSNKRKVIKGFGKGNKVKKRNENPLVREEFDPNSIDEARKIGDELEKDINGKKISINSHVDSTMSIKLDRMELYSNFNKKNALNLIIHKVSRDIAQEGFDGILNAKDFSGADFHRNLDLLAMGLHRGGMISGSMYDIKRGIENAIQMGYDQADIEGARKQLDNFIRIKTNIPDSQMFHVFSDNVILPHELDGARAALESAWGVSRGLLGGSSTPELLVRVHIGGNEGGKVGFVVEYEGEDGYKAQIDGSMDGLLESYTRGANKVTKYANKIIALYSKNALTAKEKSDLKEKAIQNGLTPEECEMAYRGFKETKKQTYGRYKGEERRKAKIASLMAWIETVSDLKATGNNVAANSPATRAMERAISSGKGSTAKSLGVMLYGVGASVSASVGDSKPAKALNRFYLTGSPFKDKSLTQDQYDAILEHSLSLGLTEKERKKRMKIADNAASGLGLSGEARGEVVKNVFLQNSSPSTNDKPTKKKGARAIIKAGKKAVKAALGYGSAKEKSDTENYYNLKDNSDLKDDTNDVLEVEFLEEHQDISNGSGTTGNSKPKDLTYEEKKEQQETLKKEFYRRIWNPDHDRCYDRCNSAPDHLGIFLPELHHKTGKNDAVQTKNSDPVNYLNYYRQQFKDMKYPGLEPQNSHNKPYEKFKKEVDAFRQKWEDTKAKGPKRVFVETEYDFKEAVEMSRVMNLVRTEFPRLLDYLGALESRMRGFEAMANKGPWTLPKSEGWTWGFNKKAEEPEVKKSAEEEAKEKEQKKKQDQLREDSKKMTIDTMYLGTDTKINGTVFWRYDPQDKQEDVEFEMNINESATRAALEQAQYSVDWCKNVMQNYLNLNNDDVIEIAQGEGTIEKFKATDGSVEIVRLGGYAEVFREYLGQSLDVMTKDTDINAIFSEIEEDEYETVLINSDNLNDAIKTFESTGKWGNYDSNGKNMVEVTYSAELRLVISIDAQNEIDSKQYNVKEQQEKKKKEEINLINADGNKTLTKANDKAPKDEKNPVLKVPIPN